MSDFDGKAYLAKKRAEAAAAYLAKKKAEAALAPPQVGTDETIINSFDEMLPGGRPAVNIASTLGLQLAKALGVGEPQDLLTDKAKQELRARGEDVPEAKSAIPGWLDTYRGVRDTRKERYEAGSEQNPWSSKLGTVGGLLTGLYATKGLSAGGPGQKFLERLGSSALTGGGYGVLNGATNGRADLTRGEVGQFAKDIIGVDGLKQAWNDLGDGNYLRSGLDVMGAGGIGGAATGAAGSLLADGVRLTADGAKLLGRQGSKLMSLIRGGYITPTPEAQRLIDRGAQLTVGQMAPKSLIAHAEELAAKKVTGGALSKARDAAADSIRDIELREASAPGAQPPTSGTSVPMQMDQLEQGYTGAYDDALTGHRVSPDSYMGNGKWRGLLTDESLIGSAKTRGAFNLATSNPNIIATPQDRQVVLDWLTEQMGQLPKSAQSGGDVAAERLQALRTTIKTEARRLTSGSATPADYAKARMLKDSANHITDLLQTQLPPNAASGLRAVDSSYNNIRALRAATSTNAAFRNEGGKFTPNQLLDAINKKGSTPALESVARDAQAVLDAKYTPTGMMGAALEGLPGGHMASQVVANGVNFVPFLRNHALTPWFEPGIPAAFAKGVGSLGSWAADGATSQDGRAALVKALLMRDPPPMSQLAGSVAQQDE